jgi:hypothetical protein
MARALRNPCCDKGLPTTLSPPAAMYYDDQARRFNLLSGLLAGVVLGAGIALLLSPDLARTPRVRLRR